MKEYLPFLIGLIVVLYLGFKVQSTINANRKKGWDSSGSMIIFVFISLFIFTGMSWISNEIMKLF